MLRGVYRCVLRWHPARFRKRFGDEMLSIFDQTQGKLALSQLVLDGLASLTLQWTLRRQFRSEAPHAAQPAAAGVPSFVTLDPFRPRSAAMIHGALLSIALFCLTVFAIRYSWIRLLHLSIPQGQFEFQPVTEPYRAFSEPSTKPAQTQFDEQAAIPPQQASGKIHDAPTRKPGVSDTAQIGAAEPATNRNFRTPSDSPSRKSTRHSALQLQVAGDTQTSAATQSQSLDPSERQFVLVAVVRNLKEHYVDRDLAQKMANSLLQQQNQSNEGIEGAAFADLLTTQMRNVSHDPHLVVVYSSGPLPHIQAPTPESIAGYRKALEEENCTFKKVEILQHNIGYLKLDSFPDPSICEPTARDAMARLNHADAVIFDLRDNRGAAPAMTALIASYLFDHPEYWYNPRANTTEELWTRSPVPGNRLADKPVYVLTSARTISGAEQFCYDLKMLKRATLVGEPTHGSAHAGVWYRIDDHFGMGIPEVRSINPYSTADWEGIGVQPDVKVNSAEALQTALALAQKKLRYK
ncbi:MAG TPA: S41 family peptidase [Dongiaceae bacterium]|nr:S41 family peptidase [Dongiaceae bacterium]